MSLRREAVEKGKEDEEEEEEEKEVVVVVNDRWDERRQKMDKMVEGKIGRGKRS
jgi:hypothetical protein